MRFVECLKQKMYPKFLARAIIATGSPIRPTNSSFFQFSIQQNKTTTPGANKKNAPFFPPQKQFRPNSSFWQEKNSQLGKECVKAKLLARIVWRHAVSERRASEEGPRKPATLLAVSAGTDVPLQGSGKLETEAICWRYAASTRLLSGWPRLAP
jgi:hypothetical protein